MQKRILVGRTGHEWIPAKWMIHLQRFMRQEAADIADDATPYVLVYQLEFGLEAMTTSHNKDYENTEHHDVIQWSELSWMKSYVRFCANSSHLHIKEFLDHLDYRLRDYKKEEGE